MNKIDLELLKMVPKVSDKAKALLEILSTKQRGRADLTFNSAVSMLDDKGIKLTRDEFKAIGKDLQQAGAGRLETVGRFLKFKWDYHLRSIACAALEMAEVTPKTKKELPINQVRVQPKPRRSLPSVRTHTNAYSKPEIIPVAATVRQTPKLAPRPSVITVRQNGIEIDLDLEKMTPAEYKKVSNLLKGLSS